MAEGGGRRSSDAAGSDASAEEINQFIRIESDAVSGRSAQSMGGAETETSREFKRMKHMKWLVAFLSVYSIIALAILWFSADDPQLVNLLSAVATSLSIPVAGLLSIFVVYVTVGPSRAEADPLPLIGCPIFVVGNGSMDVSVTLGPEGVSVRVGAPASEPLGSPPSTGGPKPS
ncbi:hypothetical protein [Sphingomonas sp. PB4P5]|uniref:hypothetical protein n=1 Tax=Parasphingomonas puruogangriensis TaxID=3096155 RepID=UPI002FC8B883